MLTYLLALAVGLGSLGLYAISFFLPELSRKNDLIWSGVGLFYGLVLWICAGRITGGVLLGQMASVALIGWLGWQMMQSRWEATPEDQRTNTETVTQIRDRVQDFLESESVAKLKDQAQSAFNKVQETVQEKVKEVSSPAPEAPPKEPTVEEKPLTPEDFGNPPIVTDVAAVPTTEPAIEPPAAKPDRPTPEKAPSLGSLLDKAKSFTGGLSTPKNKTTYVRKEFQAPEATVDVDDDFDFGELEETAQTPTETAEVAPSTASETVQEPLQETVETVAEPLQENAADAVEEAQEVIAEVVENVPELKRPNPPSNDEENA